MFGYSKKKDGTKDETQLKKESQPKNDKKENNKTLKREASVNKEAKKTEKENEFKEKKNNKMGDDTNLGKEQNKRAEIEHKKNENHTKGLEKPQESHSKQMKSEQSELELELEKKLKKAKKHHKKDQAKLKKQKELLEKKGVLLVDHLITEENGSKIVDLFKSDPRRVKKFTHTVQIGTEFLYFDYTRTHLKAVNLSEMFRGFSELNRKNDMFDKEKINYTEGRNVLHTSLRNWNVLQLLQLKEDTHNEQNENILSKEIENLGQEEKEIFHELIKLKEFANKFSNGELKGITGNKLRSVISMGIGGSDLGPRVVNEILEYYKKADIDVHFVSNIDPTEMFQALSKVDIEETLFIVISKTFTTQETLSNAQFALKMIEEKTGKGCRDIATRQFVAVSANKEAVDAFGIQNIFQMWDFVGGRYSLWSAVGLPIILSIGFNNFVRLLQGASYMDKHFENTDNNSNLPVLQALIEIFYSKKKDYNNKCIVAYDEYMKNFYKYLQQVEMESNGKSATLDGITRSQTGMIIWGGVGTNTQHSFFQLLHQGTRKVLVEFLVPLKPLKDKKVMPHSHFEMLFANCIAQSRALMIGHKNAKLDKHFSGDRPSITIAYSRLTPEILGALIAFNEHKIYIQGLYWRINSFDQFGVTLGKSIAQEVLSAMRDKEQMNSMDTATAELLRLHKEMVDRND